MAYPNIIEAFKIWHEGIDFRQHTDPNPHHEEYIFHTLGVAEISKIIADKCPGMDSDKAYILGLLHDCGRLREEFHTDVFHGKEGYDLMMKSGYDEVARICLTHCFLNQDFKFEDYSYPKHWLQWGKDNIKDIIYEDYDLLIQFCDLHLEGLNFVTIDNRIKGIMGRYNVSYDQMKAMHHRVLELKEYFDKKCSCNIYRLIGLD